MRPQVRSEKRQLLRDAVLVALALVSVGIGLWQISADPTTIPVWLDAVDFGIVAVFWVDFVLEARRVGWGRYIRTHWWELPSLIPPLPALVASAPALALARAFRLLRLARVVSVLLRLRPAGAYVVRLARRARVDIILGVGAVTTLVASVLFYLLERGVNDRVDSFGQATWFAFNMFTNVAFVDFQPATLGGRVLAGILQLCGIAFIGIFTASLAGAILREDAAERD